MTNIRVETEKLQSVAGQLKSNSTSIGGVGGRLLNAGSSARTYDNNSFGPKVRAICTDSNARALNIGGILGGMAGMLNRKVNAFIQADSIFSQEMGKKNLSFEFPSLIGIDARGEINDLINSKRYKFVEDQWNKMDIEQRKHFLNKFQASLLFLYGYPLASDEIIFTDLPDINGDYKGRYFENKITVDITNVETDGPFPLMRTIAHENRHAMQDHAIQNPEFRPDGITDDMADEWQDNFDNYIESENDFEGYWKQVVEKDARATAVDYVNGYVNDYGFSSW